MTSHVPSAGESSHSAQPTSSFNKHEMTLSSKPAQPRPILTTDALVAQWHTTPGFRLFWSWITRQCDRIKGKEILQGDDGISSKTVASLMDLLEQMTKWVQEAPPHPQSNQRFGNLAFRQYIKLVESRVPDIVRNMPNIPLTLVDQILPLLIQSNAFGHTTRLDYGTGHELAFVLALWCCVISGWIGGQGKEAEEDELVLRVFPRYLELVTLLQQTYKLEPAGSHGVWGLDDYCFFPYLFGSAQLLGSEVTPTRALQRASQSTPSSPITDMYTLSLHRITLFKTGASFSEHSPLLHQLSSFPDWKKPHAGLRKMFMGEVAGKRVVVQGLWIGGWTWGDDLPKEKAEDNSQIGSASTPTSITPAPWAQVDSRTSTLEATRGSWSGTIPPRR